MSFEEFKEQLMSYVQEHISEYLPPQYAGATIVPSSKSEINGGTVEGFEFHVEGYQTSPIVYINDMYDRFMDDPYISDNSILSELDKKSLTDNIANRFVRGMGNPIAKQYAAADLIAEKIVPENLFMVVLNTEANQDILSNCPHREVLDLSIMYKILISDESESRIASTRVTNMMAMQMGMTEEQIFQTAYANTRRMFPPTVQSMAEVIREMMHKETEEPYMHGAETMLVATNDRRINGACMMLYPDVLDEMAERLGSDIYICPSSVHEILGVSVFGQTGEEMEEIVREVNATQVSVEERLSNHAYVYDSKGKKLSFATDDIAPPINPDIAWKAAVAENKTYSLQSGYLPASEELSQEQRSVKPAEMTTVSPVRQRGPKL